MGVYQNAKSGIMVRGSYNNSKNIASYITDTYDSELKN